MIGFTTMYADWRMLYPTLLLCFAFLQKSLKTYGGHLENS